MGCRSPLEDGRRAKVALRQSAALHWLRASCVGLPGELAFFLSPHPLQLGSAVLMRRSLVAECRNGRTPFPVCSEAVFLVADRDKDLEDDPPLLF